MPKSAIEAKAKFIYKNPALELFLEDFNVPQFAHESYGLTVDVFDQMLQDIIVIEMLESDCRTYAYWSAVRETYS